MPDITETRVARGAALLDEELPGWYDRIDLDRLDLEKTCNCILGQEFAGRVDAEGSYDTAFDVGVSELFAGHEDAFIPAVEHGFDRDLWDAPWDVLTREWRRVILARRAVTA